MKGLFIKDLCLLKGQKKFWLGILVISIAFLGLFENPSFVICYMTLMAAMFTSSTLNYDEFQNGMSYLLTLPVGREGYVREKYVFGLSISFFATFLGYALTLAAGVITGINYESGELFSAAISGILIAMVMIAVMVPLQLKFGSEKGRIALLAVYGIFFLAAYISIKWLNIPFMDILSKLDDILEDSYVRTTLLFLGTGSLLMLISYFLSAWIMRKKEF